MENLRQLCIYKQSYMDWGRKKWWDYITKIHENCRGQANELCSINAHRELSLDYEVTKKCVAGSFNMDSSNYNSPEIVNHLID